MFPSVFISIHWSLLPIATIMPTYLLPPSLFLSLWCCSPEDQILLSDCASSLAVQVCLSQHITHVTRQDRTAGHVPRQPSTAWHVARQQSHLTTLWGHMGQCDLGKNSPAFPRTQNSVSWRGVAHTALLGRHCSYSSTWCTESYPGEQG